MKCMKVCMVLFFIVFSAVQTFAGFNEGMAAYNAGDYPKAFGEFKGLAEQGDKFSQNNLGIMYLNGQGVVTDKQEAAKWFKKAAEQGNADAQNNLGLMYEFGSGVARDYNEAVKWYRTAAEQGHAVAQKALGVMYDHGLGVATDKQEAVKWYKKSAEQGNAGGQFSLGTMYDKGEGVARDYNEAMKWYRKAAEQGNSNGQNNLAKMYANAEGVARDYNEAMKWYRKAAEHGHAVAQYNLGLMYSKGEGAATDKQEAVKWFEKAAKQGNKEAKNKLNQLLELSAKHDPPEDEDDKYVVHKNTIYAAGFMWLRNSNFKKSKLNIDKIDDFGNELGRLNKKGYLGKSTWTYPSANDFYDLLKSTHTFTSEGQGNAVDKLQKIGFKDVKSCYIYEHTSLSDDTFVSGAIDINKIPSNYEEFSKRLSEGKLSCSKSGYVWLHATPSDNY
ncbi:tetratricopeptide repeat protein [Trichlorobacter lovleyi]|uniref:tetratricopeptide repeat protein n=1 Tax=Trichlorobacter lovleyi TaxID=313985 RepID=UPI003D0C9544